MEDDDSIIRKRAKDKGAIPGRQCLSQWALAYKNEDSLMRYSRQPLRMTLNLCGIGRLR